MYILSLIRKMIEFLLSWIFLKKTSKASGYVYMDSNNLTTGSTDHGINLNINVQTEISNYPNPVALCVSVLSLTSNNEAA